MTVVEKSLDKVLIEIRTSDWESSSGLTPQYASFFRRAKNALTKFLKEQGADNIEIKRGHFELSGFFDMRDRTYYFSFSDVRFFPDNGMLLRTAKNHTDYTGGNNCFVRTKDCPTFLTDFERAILYSK